MASVDGLVTGMNTTDTIAQLMQIEAAPQAALTTKITTANKVVTAYQSIKTRLSSIASAAKVLNDPDTWGSLKATSSSDAAIASTKAGAVPGTLSFHVERLATTHVDTYTGGSVTSLTNAATSPVMSGATIDVVLTDGTTKQLTPSNQSLQSVIAAINGEKDAPYKASAVLVSAGNYTLQLTAKQSGTAGETAIATAGLPTGLTLGIPTPLVTAQDAWLSVDGPNGTFDVTSTSNTFTDLMPGITVTAVKLQTTASGDPVKIDLTADGEGIAAKVQAMIDNANVALTEIAAQSKIKSGDTAAGALVGDSAMRKLTQDILATVSYGADKLGQNGTTASFNEVNIGVDKFGKLTRPGPSSTSTRTRTWPAAPRTSSTPAMTRPSAWPASWRPWR
jgi:flagellar hook-associated protein 2